MSTPDTWARSLSVAKRYNEEEGLWRWRAQQEAPDSTGPESIEELGASRLAVPEYSGSLGSW